jgi:hypothetical protein
MAGFFMLGVDVTGSAPRSIALRALAAVIGVRNLHRTAMR